MLGGTPRYSASPYETPSVPAKQPVALSSTLLPLQAADPVEGLELAIPPVTTTKIRTIHRRQHKPGNIRSAIRELKHLLQQAPAPELGRKPSFMERREREPRAAAHGRTV